MELFELLKKTISKMPTGWGETVEVNLTNGWTPPSDGILKLSIRGDKDVAYIADKTDSVIMGGLCLYNGLTSTCAPVKKGEVYKVSYRGPGVKSLETYFTPYSYRGGYLSRLIKRLQSLTFKGVMA